MADVQLETIETKVPARLDRLPWSRFHWRIVIGLGTVWILDGLEVTMIGSVASRLTEKGSGIALTSADIGLAAAIYVAGACLGALFFGQLTDRFGRKKLFLITLVVYLLATVATAFAFSPLTFFIARFFTGAGIGGEYAAINSAIDELIPARARGRVDLLINGSYWLGAAGGALLSLVFLDTTIFAADLGWRVAFGVGAVMGIAILFVRRHVPESPRWLFIHGQEEEAERLVNEIEEGILDEIEEDELPEAEDSITVRQREHFPFSEIARTAFKVYPRRAWLGLSLFVGQAFIYNAVVFTFGLALTTFLGVKSGEVGYFFAAFAIGNFMGPLLLGRLFDTVGRKPMIAGTYLTSAAMLVVVALLFNGGTLNEYTLTGLLIATFFFASAGASAAYLTVSEIFPMEVRALAIAFFYALGTAIGGISGPLLFGRLVETGDASKVMIGYLIGAVVMAIGGITEIFLGVKAEQQKLEDIAKPLTAEEAEEGEPGDVEAGREDEQEGDKGQEAAGEADERSRLEEAERERARAAEHRSKAHELRARAAEGDAEAEQGAEVESGMAEVADLRAQAHEQRAEAHEQRRQAEAAEDDDTRDSALEQADAADARAKEYEERVAALAAHDEEEAARHEDAAQAARERALASDSRVEAAEHQDEAEQQRERKESAGERAQRAREADARIRRRLERRERERQGLRRFRPGPGKNFYTRFPAHPYEEDLATLDREVESIARALQDHGELDRRELARLVGARYWGPGRFSGALREAVGDGAARRVSRQRFGPADGARR